MKEKPHHRTKTPMREKEYYEGPAKPLLGVRFANQASLTA